MSNQRPTHVTDQYTQAVAYAARVHGEQVRKGTNVPYISHLLGVSSLILEAGGDETQAIAGLLHDAPEDHGGRSRLAEIRDLFGGDVADIVEVCSDSLAEDPNAKDEYWPRKEHHLARLAEAEAYPLLVVLADKAHNGRAIATDLTRFGPRYLDRFNGSGWEILRYYRANLQIGVQKGVSRAILVPLESAIATLTQYVDGPLRDVTPPDEYDVLPEDQWPEHTWLKQLTTASDMDGDAARVIFGASPEASRTLSKVILQYRDRKRGWVDSAFSDVDIWAYTPHERGVTAWYYPADYHPGFQFLPDNDYPRPEWRALFPKGWTSP